MAKLIVSHDVDPSIAVTLEEVHPDTPGRAQGFYGRCTECPRTFHRWHQDRALTAARRHVDSHTPVVFGLDDKEVRA